MQRMFIPKPQYIMQWYDQSRKLFWAIQVIIHCKVLNCLCSTNIFQAEDISRHAKFIFEALDVVPQHLDLDSSLMKRRPGRKPKNWEQKTSQRDSTGMKTCSSIHVDVILTTVIYSSFLENNLLLSFFW